MPQCHLRSAYKDAVCTAPAPSLAARARPCRPCLTLRASSRSSGRRYRLPADTLPHARRLLARGGAGRGKRFGSDGGPATRSLDALSSLPSTNYVNTMTGLRWSPDRGRRTEYTPYTYVRSMYISLVQARTFPPSSRRLGSIVPIASSSCACVGSSLCLEMIVPKSL